MIERLLHTLSVELQSTHLFNFTQGGLNPALFAFNGHAISFTLLIASPQVSTILFFPTTIITLSGPKVIAATLFPL